MNDSTSHIPAAKPQPESTDLAKKPAAEVAGAGEAAPHQAAAATSDTVAPQPSPAGQPAAKAADVNDAEPSEQANAAQGTAVQPRLAKQYAARRQPQPPARLDVNDHPQHHKKRTGAPAVQGYQFEDVVSGRFDEDEVSADVLPAKRVLLPQAETPKLHKVLAQAGLGSRLEMEQLILEGRISVNNEPAHIGQRIQFGDQVKVNGKPIRFRIDPPPARVIAYHKPVGEVVTHDDPQNRPTVFRKLPRLAQGKWQSVGRLDLNTEGLLLLTSSGELANKLMHPRFGLEREYAVRVLGALSKEEKQKLLDGVRLDDGMAAFGTIEDGGGEGSNCWYRVTISEGRNREVRRMLESVGHAVSRLIRIRYGAMVLPRGLKRGAWLELDESDIRALVHAAGAGRPEGAQVEERGGESRATRSGARGRNGPRGSGPRSNPSPAAPGSGTVKSRRDAAGSAQGNRAGKAEGGAQPDPMKTSVGYIGVDSLSRFRQDKRRPVAGGPRRRGGR